MQLNDIVAVLSAVEYPVILRKELSYYRFVGCAYIPAFEHGQMVMVCKQAHYPLQMFEIQ